MAALQCSIIIAPRGTLSVSNRRAYGSCADFLKAQGWSTRALLVRTCNMSSTFGRRGRTALSPRVAASNRRNSILKKDPTTPEKENTGNMAISTRGGGKMSSLKKGDKKRRVSFSTHTQELKFDKHALLAEAPKAVEVKKLAPVPRYARQFESSHRCLFCRCSLVCAGSALCFVSLATAQRSWCLLALVFEFFPQSLHDLLDEEVPQFGGHDSTIISSKGGSKLSNTDEWAGRQFEGTAEFVGLPRSSLNVESLFGDGGVDESAIYSAKERGTGRGAAADFAAVTHSLVLEEAVAEPNNKRNKIAHAAPPLAETSTREIIEATGTIDRWAGVGSSRLIAKVKCFSSLPRSTHFFSIYLSIYLSIYPISLSYLSYLSSTYPIDLSISSS
jgi:hypothetical protein